jgi:small-conductance mechanosensitive channel/CRP-like cAMP-binding protein
MFPVIVSAALFGLYFFLQTEPLLLGDFGDIREQLFGRHLARLLFAAFVPVIFLAVRLFDTVTFDLVMSRRRNVVAPQLLRQILAITLYIVLFGALSSAVFNFSITGLLTTTTVLAAVLGLALQDTLGNLFSGIALHMEGGFETGDVIRSGDFIGKVESVSWRATRIRGFANQTIVLPNSVLARERVEVFPLGNANGRVLTIGVDYHVAPATVISILSLATTHIEGVAREMPVIVRVAGFGESSLTYDVKYYTHDFTNRDRIDAEIRKAAWYALNRNGIAQPFPIRSFQPYTPPKPESAISQQEIEAILQQVDVLSPLSGEARALVASAARVHVWAKGETIIRHGTLGESMFVVHSGSVSVRVGAETPGGWSELAQLGAGSVVGEMALLTGERRTADVVAVTEVVTLEIGKAALQPILQQHPELAAAISAKVMERRDRNAIARTPEMDEQKSVLSRIRAYFGL